MNAMLLCDESFVKMGLEAVPVESFARKSEASTNDTNMRWEDAAEAGGGIMLFTSGTTSRPVR